jgi:hypothetical protein
MTSSGRGTPCSKRIRLCAIGLASLSALAFTVPGSAQARQTATPTASTGRVIAAAAPAPYVDSDAILPNPERGLFDHNGDCDANAFDETRIIRLRREKNITLVRCIFYLEGYQNRDLDQAIFTKLNNRAAAAKRLGVKMVLRFAYSKASSVDADLPQALEHIDQLGPWLQANYSVIQVLESGFVGQYGEGYYTTHYGDQGTISTQQWAKRNAIIKRLLTVLPANRSIQVRSVQMKKDHFGPTVTVIGPPAKPEAARIGVHNDCLFGFFRDQLTDQGTYRNDADKNFLAADSLYVPVGGEICGSVGPTPARTSCANALTELARFHWTHLSNGQGAATRDKWVAQGCMPQVERSLGYRLSIAGSSFPSSVPRGQTFLAQVIIKNSGWAAPIANRPVQLVLRNTATKSEHVLTFTSARPKTWLPGKSVLIAGQFGIGFGTSPGNYELLLRLPDTDPNRRAAITLDDPNDPNDTPQKVHAYDIQLATVGAWEANTGLNKLQRYIKVE